MAPRHGEQHPGIVQTVYIVTRFCQQVRVPALAARNVQNARSDRQFKKFDDTRHLAAVALRGEERSVLKEIVGVEGRFPPLTLPGQKNTGSR
ncbi:MAG TPA: hypothetical protein VEM14_09915 [Gemmatimonadaceae bacterium]|nr:hypothetical protein [Gemmatimonadaceae bacterium]